MFSAGSYQLTVYFILSPLRTKKGGDNQGYTTGLSCMSAIEPGWGSVLFNNVSFSSFNGAIFTTGIRIILFHSNSHTEEKTMETKWWIVLLILLVVVIVGGAYLRYNFWFG
jgi:hypothetical protein